MVRWQEPSTPTPQSKISPEAIWSLQNHRSAGTSHLSAETPTQMENTPGLSPVTSHTVQGNYPTRPQLPETPIGGSRRHPRIRGRIYHAIPSTPRTPPIPCQMEG